MFILATREMLGAIREMGIVRDGDDGPSRVLAKTALDLGRASILLTGWLTGQEGGDLVKIDQHLQRAESEGRERADRRG